MCSVMRKLRSFGEMNLKYGIFSKTKKKKKSDGKFLNFFFSRPILTGSVGVRGNKLIFNFGLNQRGTDNTMTKRKRTNDLQNMTQKAKDRGTWTPLNTRTWVAQTSIKFKSQLNLKCKLIWCTFQVNLSVN